MRKGQENDRRRQFVLAATSLCVALLGQRAQAALIRYEFAGTINHVSGTSLVEVGDSFAGRFTFDSATPDLTPDNPNVGYFLHPNPLGANGISFQAGTGLSYSTEQDARFMIIVSNGVTVPVVYGHQISFVDSTASMAESPTVSFAHAALELAVPGAYSANDSLLTTLNLRDFSWDHDFYFEGLKPNPGPAGGFLVVVHISGTVTSLMAVPEPTSLMLATLGLVGLIAWRGMAAGWHLRGHRFRKSAST